MNKTLEYAKVYTKSAMLFARLAVPVFLRGIQQGWEQGLLEAHERACKSNVKKMRAKM